MRMGLGSGWCWCNGSVGLCTSINGDGGDVVVVDMFVVVNLCLWYWKKCYWWCFGDMMVL